LYENLVCGFNSKDRKENIHNRKLLGLKQLVSTKRGRLQQFGHAGFCWRRYGVLVCPMKMLRTEKNEDRESGGYGLTRVYLEKRR